MDTDDQGLTSLSACTIHDGSLVVKKSAVWVCVCVWGGGGSGGVDGDDQDKLLSLCTIHDGSLVVWKRDRSETERLYFLSPY